MQFVPPSGRDFTTKNATGSTESNDSDANANGYTDVVIVPPGQNGEVGAGLMPLVSIGNRFWEDANANGIQDAGEPGVSGATVKLWVDTDKNGTADTLLRTTTTTGSGSYAFNGLDASLHYLVQFVPPRVATSRPKMPWVATKATTAMRTPMATPMS